MQKYDGEVIWFRGEPFAIAERYSPGITLFSQDTGRWSQKEIPDAQLPQKMRKLKGVDPGKKQVGYDLSNAELRILAILAKDEVFITSFQKNWDLHTINACDLFGWPYPPNPEKHAIFHGDENKEWREEHQYFEEDHPFRKFAKIFNFRVIYSCDPMGGYKIPGAAQTKLTKTEFQQRGAAWIAKHQGLDKFWQYYGDQGINVWCVRNPYGRRRVLCNPDDQKRKREAINHPIQSFVSDFINDIFLETCETVPEAELMGQMHDSLLWQLPEDKFDELLPKVLEIPSRPFELDGNVYQFPISHYIKEASHGV